MRQFFKTIKPKSLAYSLLAIICFGIVSAAIIHCIRFNTETKQLTEKKYHLEQLLVSHDDWRKKANWIQDGIPRFDVNFDSEQALNLYIEGSLAETNLNILEISKINKQASSVSAPNNYFFRKSTSKVVVVGSERDIVKWLHQAQSPEAFVSVDQIKLEVIALKTLRCEANISISYDTIDRLVQANQLNSYGNW